MDKTEYDAIVVGSGPNGLAAALTFQQSGLSTLILEAKSTIGGGLRSAALTLPGYLHDVCAAIHPLSVSSPFFSSLPLEAHGLQYIYSEVAAAHPFDDGRAIALKAGLEETAATMGADEQAYLRLFKPLLGNWPGIVYDVLGPLRFPAHPVNMASFGIKALQPASLLVRKFKSKEARGLFAGMAAHSMQPLENMTTSAIALVLMTTGHLKGWPLLSGGSQKLADALASFYSSLGGKIETGAHVRSLSELPSSKVILLDLTPRQILEIGGDRLSALYKWQLERYRYGMGVFKIDWALSGQVPFIAPECRQAGTVHLGNTFEEIAQSERLTSVGHHPEKPYVLLSQQSIFDRSRAPEGKHTAWAYCHVPHGSEKDMTAAIEDQVERFAPGFKDLILARHTMNTKEMNNYNPNYIGGDIGGGVMDLTQLYTRPAMRWSPYRTSAKGIYVCSSSTPPGGGVHGMCGYHAARRALKDIFRIKM